MTYCYDATKGMKTVNCTMRCYNYKLKRVTICRFYITNKTKQENPFLNNTKQDNHFFTIGEHRSSFNK